MNSSFSVRFTEEMKGYVSFGEEDYERGAREGRKYHERLMVHLTIEVDDLDRLAADAGRAAEARGWVVFEALGGRLPLEKGIFNLLVEEEDPAIQHMLYRLYFRDGVGHPVTFAGFKTLTNRRGLHVWRDTTTLYTRLLRGHVEAGDDPGAEIVASGILHIRPLGFLRQLATFRAGGRRSPDPRPSSASTPSSSGISGTSTVCTAGAVDSQPGGERVGQSPRTGISAVAGVAAQDDENAAGQHADSLSLGHPHRR
jgi:hypothetical protein